MYNKLVRFVQDKRKELNLEYTDRISLGVIVSSEEQKHAVMNNSEYIMQETLASSFKCVMRGADEEDELRPADDRTPDPIGFSWKGDPVDFNIAKEG